MNLRIRNLSTATIVAIGFGLMFVAQTFHWQLVKVDVDALIANTGALILVVGFLQWLFDEDSREALINRITEKVTERIVSRERCGALGLVDCVSDSKSICSPAYANELARANKLVIGFQYSDGLIDRYRQIIRDRIDSGLVTQVAHVRSNGIAADYLGKWAGRNIDVGQKVADMLTLADRYFGATPLVRYVSHDVVIRYSFVYTESAIWLTFMTNSHLRQAVIPALKVQSGTPLYEFLKSDIRDLGVEV